MAWLLAFITYIGWGAGDIFGIYATRKVGAYLTFLYIFIAGFILSSLYLPFALADLPKITLTLFLFNFVLGLLYVIGNFLISEAFRVSNASIVGIIIQSFPAVVLVLSALIFKDVVTTKQAIWISVILVGIVLCSIDFNDLKKGLFLSDRGVKLALVAAAILSVYFTFFRVFTNAYGWFLPNYISFITFPLAIPIIKKLFNYTQALTIVRDNKVLLACVITAILIRGADIALNYGIAIGYSAIVAPVASSAPTLFIVLSSLIYKDPVTKQQKAGILVCLLGIILLSFFA